MSVSFAGLGSSAMRRAICLASARTGSPMILVARQAGVVGGLAIAAYDTESFWRRFFLRHPLLALAVILKRLSGRRNSLRGTATAAPARTGADWSDAGPRIAKILFVGVATEHRTRGLAARIYGELMLRLARRGITRVDARIATGNAASIRLHERTGWTLRRDEGCVFATRSLL